MKELEYGKVYQVKNVNGKDSDIVACYVNGIVEYVDQNYDGDEYFELVVLDNELNPIGKSVELMSDKYGFIWYVKELIGQRKYECKFDTIEYEGEKLEIMDIMDNIPSEKLKTIEKFAETYY